MEDAAWPWNYRGLILWKKEGILQIKSAAREYAARRNGISHGKRALG
jgi:hypothetical protein